MARELVLSYPACECACMDMKTAEEGEEGSAGKEGEKKKREEGKQRKQSSARAKSRVRAESRGRRMRRPPFHKQAGKAMPRLSDVQIDEQGGTRNERASARARAR